MSEPDKGVAQIYLCDADIDVISQGPSEDGSRGQECFPVAVPFSEFLKGDPRRAGVLQLQIAARRSVGCHERHGSLVGCPRPDHIATIKAALGQAENLVVPGVSGLLVGPGLFDRLGSQPVAVLHRRFGRMIRSRHYGTVRHLANSHRRAVSLAGLPTPQGIKERVPDCHVPRLARVAGPDRCHMGNLGTSCRCPGWGRRCAGSDRLNSS